MLRKSILGIIIALTVVLLFVYISDSTDLPESSETTYIIEASKEHIKWNNIVEEEGSIKGYENFKDFFKELYLVQHSMSHIFGELLYEKDGVEGVTVCDSTFAFGCFHGFFTAAISDVGLEIIPSLDDACGWSTECQHGIGHGAMEYMRHDLEGALSACDLTNQPDPLAGCTSGVFMEYNVPLIVSESETGVIPRILNKGKPYEPCDIIPERFRNSCYHELGQWWNQVYEKDYTLMGQLCSNVQNDIYRISCFSGIGQITPDSTNYNLELSIELCEKMPTEEGVFRCKAATSWSFKDSPSQSFKGVSVCEGLEEDEKKHCLQIGDLE